MCETKADTRPHGGADALLLALTLCLVAAASTACSDPPVSAGAGAAAKDAVTSTDSVTRFGDASANPDSPGGDDAGDGVDGGNGDDDADAAADAVSDTLDIYGPADVVWSGDDVDIGPAPDVSKPDISYSALEVVSTDPTADGFTKDLNGTFSVTFSGPLEAITVSAYTVKVLGPNGAEIAGSFAVDGATMTWKADAELLPTARVVATVGTLLTDQAGRSLEAPFTLRVLTPGYADQAPYEALARRYAPVLDVVLADGALGDLDVPRWPTDIGGWELQKSAAAAPLGPFLPRVGWSVVETQSHFYVHYLLYWPRRAGEGGAPAFDNDSAGFTVVVARFPDERPIAVQSYSKRLDDERMWLWLSDDAALLPPGAKLSTSGVRGVYPASALFPPKDDGFGCEGLGKGCMARRAPLWIEGGVHRACLSLDGGEQGGQKACAWNADIAASARRLRLLPASTPTAVITTDAKKGGPAIVGAYALERVDTGFFARRTDVDAYDAPLTFTYSAPAGRPAAPPFAVGSKFAGGGSSAFGRPPWAYRWKPATNETYYDLPRGTVFLDAAWALYRRLGGAEAGVPAFDAGSKAGMSLAYCFNPFLYIDGRATAPCLGSLPSPTTPP